MASSQQYLTSNGKGWKDLWRDRFCLDFALKMLANYSGVSRFLALALSVLGSPSLFSSWGSLAESCSPSSSTTRWSILCLTFKTFYFRPRHHMGRKIFFWDLWLFQSSGFRTWLFSIKNTQIMPWNFWSKSKLRLRVASHTSWQRSRIMFLLYRSEKNCSYMCSLDIVTIVLLAALTIWIEKNAEFANLSQVKGKNIEDGMCHTDFREALTLNLVPVISGSWLISGADMGCWNEWQTCHLRDRNIWT